MQLDYSPQVDVRAISGREKAVAEMAKYPVKTADLLTLDLNTAALAAYAVPCHARAAARYLRRAVPRNCP